MPAKKHSNKVAVSESKEGIGEGDVLSKPKKTLVQTNFGKRWYRFHVLTPNSAILHGSYSMNDQRFKFRSRGRQAVPCSIVAIVYGRLFEPKQWTQDYIDQILQYGDKLFRVSVARNHINDDQYMTTRMIHPEFYISNYKIVICAEETGIYGNLFTESVGCPDFGDGLEKFFASYNAGIITAQGTSMACWRQPELGFLYFDPAPCDEQGTRFSDGVACLMRFKCMNDLRDRFLKSMDKRYDSRYCIDKVTILRVKDVLRGYLGRVSSTDRLTIEKSVLNSINPVDINENKLDCTKPVPKTGKTKTPMPVKIVREPLSITISNYSIDKHFATDPLVDQNAFNTGYDYEDMRANVPPTFRDVSKTMSILHGVTHEGNPAFKAKGAQNVANCAMSIAVKKVHPVKTWLPSKLDEILVQGDALYATVKSEKPTMKSMTAADLNDVEIQVEGRKMVIDVDLLTVTGTLSSKLPAVLNLKQALEEFFLVNKEGIIESSSMAMAIWSQEDCYYSFDPRPCDSLGVRVREEKGGKGGKGAKGGDAQKEKKEKGKCCVIRFHETDSVAELFLKNVDQAKRNDRFTIRHITVMDNIPGTRAWHEFQPGKPGETWVLRGNIANDDESLGEESQGVQGLAMPVVGLVCAKETTPSKWTDDTVDKVVREGDAYYNWCIPPAEGEEEPDRNLLVPRLKRNLYFNNKKIKIDIEEATIIGDLTSSPESSVPNLEKAIVQFFQTRQYGIVESKNLSVAVWKTEEEIKEKDKEPIKQVVYYCFDANPRNKLGEWNLGDDLGTACVIRTLLPSVVAKLIETNIARDPQHGKDFVIHDLKSINIGSQMTDEEIEADKQIPVKPELNQYANISDEGAILLGSFNQANETIFKRLTRDKQQAGISLAALATTKLYNPHLWYREVLDDILKLGDKITMDNLENLAEPEVEDEVPRNYLLPSEINEAFTVGVNRMSITLEEEMSVGPMNDLVKELETFFEGSTMGIFRQDAVMMPIWREGKIFFTLDPKGRDTRGEPKEKDGFAAVMWFTNIQALATAIQAVAHGEEFIIDNVTLENVYETRVTEGDRPKRTTSGEDLWHNFPKLAEGVWNIDGNTTMDDGRFDEENRNNQTAAISVVAIVFSKVYEPRYWTTAVLDEVIVTGDKLHSKCVERLGKGSIPKVNEIISEFFLSTRRIGLIIIDCVEAGNLTKKTAKVQNLQDGIDNFFVRFNGGTLTVEGNKNIAMWKINDVYYAFVPDWINATEASSVVTPRLFRFINSELLTEYLLSVLGNTGDYEIAAVQVIDWNKFPPWKFDPSPAIRPSNLPPRNAYKRLPGDARAILRGSYHQGDEIFPESLRNRQTASNCVVALGMSVVKSPVTWTKKTMDEILAIGCNVHRETKKAKLTKNRLKPEDIIRIFYVGTNILTADIEPNTVTGLVAIAPPDPEEGKKKKKGGKKKAKGGKKKGKGSQRVRPPPPPPILLEEGLRKFFEKNRAGILVTERGGMVAIWKDMGVYFMYDPRSRSNQGLPELCGTSCVMWFACIEPFYELIFTNIDQEEKYGRYEICRVIIKTTIIEPLPCPAGFRPYFDCAAPPITVPCSKKSTTVAVETVTQYNFVDEELSVLLGTLHMHHHTFGVKSKGLQSTAIAAVAIVVGLLHVPSTWTPELIDAILKYGDLLHSDSVRIARCGPRNLSPSELLTVFIVGDFRACIHVHNHTTAGILHVFDLSEALTMFFRTNCAGILHTSNLAVAVMQHYGKFYLLDPCRRNDQGRSGIEGAACLMKCENVTKMASMFVTNCNLKTPNVYTLNAVNVLSLHFFSDAKSSCPPKCER